MNKTPHKNLEAWKVSMYVVEKVYVITKEFPLDERYGLISQMKRAAISVPSNIAEGAADRTRSQFANYLGNALGSLSELDTQIELSHRLGFINDQANSEMNSLLDRCKGLIYGLKKSLK